MANLDKLKLHNYLKNRNSQNNYFSFCLVPNNNSNLFFFNMKPLSKFPILRLITILQQHKF